MITEITKRGFKKLIWLIMGIGLILNFLGYLILIQTLDKEELQSLVFLVFGLLFVGFALGLAYSRIWLIKDFERRF